MRGTFAVSGLFVFTVALMTGAMARSAEAPTAEFPPTPAPRVTAIPAAPTSTPEIVRTRTARRFIVPIVGATLPTDPSLYPEALRDYRAGVHEGVDFPARAGIPVRAAAAGTVVRADAQFKDWTDEEREAALTAAIKLGRTPERTLDLIRGRQVWIDHGDGVVTRYAHLLGVAPLVVGGTIAEGAVIGNVGSSGYPQGGPHLHFEIRIGADYLGDGLTPVEVARVYARAFR